LPEITKLAEFTVNTLSMGDKSTAYVCQDFACKSPTTDIDEMLSHLS